VHTAERLLLLTAMAGFLVIGLSIPRGFGRYGAVLGFGYLLVVVVHTVLYHRVNANILRVTPFNVGSAVLVIVAGFVHGPGGQAGPASYALWAVALAVQLGSPLIVHPGGLFELRPAHFSERHSALLIVAIGESVAAVGIGAGPAADAGPVSWRLLASAVLGLAVAAALWWIVFGAGDEERAEKALAEATAERRTGLALSAFFYGNIPLLLGLIALAAGILREIVQTAGQPGPAAGAASAGQSAMLAVGAALFLAGEVIIRAKLRTGPVRLRAAAAVVALATVPAGMFAGLNVQLVLIAVVLIAPLVAEGVAAAWPGEGETAEGATGDDGAG
jgi:low temperature requirement protein LtrA